MLLFRDVFGDRALLLCGIIVNPNAQRKEIGKRLLQFYLKTEKPGLLAAFTRNPGVVRLLSEAADIDALSPEIQANVYTQIPDTHLIDGVTYDLDRYAPHGLYGGADPALGFYNGEPLMKTCPMLINPNNALAILVPVKGE